MEHPIDRSNNLVGWKIALVVPCYRSGAAAVETLSNVPDFISRIYAVDDGCPIDTGQLLEQEINDDRLVVIYHDTNSGVGAAVKTGYRAALEDGMDIAVKFDSDGQMSMEDVERLCKLIVLGQADYVKGNRFFSPHHVKEMPTLRLAGNAALTLLSRASTGYWDTSDPTNGLTAIDLRIIDELDLDLISDRWFFESDILFRLGLARCVVQEIPILARYGGVQSNLRVRSVLWPFLAGNTRNFMRRIGYMYFLRSMTVASLELLAGLALTAFGLAFGLISWIANSSSQVSTPLGTVMISAVSVLLGVQFLLAFIGTDISSVPTRPVAGRLIDLRR